MTSNRLAPPLALTLAMMLLAPAPPARAQPPEEAPAAAEGEGSGRSLDGYFATGILAFMAMFAVAKTARRG